MSIYCYAELTDESGKGVEKVLLSTQKNKLIISSSQKGKETIQLKYAISYISIEQAKKNFAIELNNKNFNQTVAEGKIAWQKVINQIEVTSTSLEGFRDAWITTKDKATRRAVLNHGEDVSGGHRTNKLIHAIGISRS
jgi:hypothetical protein